jgi:hypothetical protein
MEVFIGWEMKFKIIRIFLAMTVKKWLVFQFKRSNSYSNGQISIQADKSRAVVSLPPDPVLARAGASLTTQSRCHVLEGGR